MQVPVDERYFEDYPVGARWDHPDRIKIGTDAIIGFAQEFDPQYFHVDPEAAVDGPFGGLVASGWHTTGVMMRLYADQYLSRVASLGGPGVDELRWTAPVRPGDVLWLRTEILEARRSRSKPDRGLVRTRVEVLNQDDVVVLRAVVLNFLAVREEGS